MNKFKDPLGSRQRNGGNVGNLYSIYREAEANKGGAGRQLSRNIGTQVGNCTKGSVASLMSNQR